MNECERSVEGKNVEEVLAAGYAVIHHNSPPESGGQNPLDQRLNVSTRGGHPSPLRTWAGHRRAARRKREEREKERDERGEEGS